MTLLGVIDVAIDEVHSVNLKKLDTLTGPVDVGLRESPNMNSFSVKASTVVADTFIAWA